VPVERSKHYASRVEHNVVCISSEDGAGAQEAAQLVASSLGFRLIDEDIVARAAVEAGVDEGVVADVERRKSRVMRLVEGLGSSGLGAGYAVPGVDYVNRGEPASDELRAVIRSAIDDAAASGSAVIVSHAASLALAERGDVLRVLVTAPPRTRERRLAAIVGMDEKAATQAVKRSDAARRDYIKRFYDIDAELPTHYDLVINTDKLTPEDAARLIVHAAGGPAAMQTADA
jgi:cytidylate kinase